MRLPISGRSSCGIGPGVFDRQVRYAARRIEPVRRRECIGRADRQAARAGAAAIGVRRVGRRCQRGVDLAQEQPGSVPARHQVGVLALPAHPGRLRQRFLHHRRGIDEHLHRRRRTAHTTNCARCFSMSLDHVVVVADCAHRPRSLPRSGCRSGPADRLRGHRTGPARRRCAPPATAPAVGCAAPRARPASPCRRAGRRRGTRASRSRASGPSSARQKPMASKPSASARSRISGAADAPPGQVCAASSMSEPRIGFRAAAFPRRFPAC